MYSMYQYGELKITSLTRLGLLEWLETPLITKQPMRQSYMFNQRWNFADSRPFSPRAATVLNNNMAKNLQTFTLYCGSRRFVAWDCWTYTSWQVMQRDNDMLIAVSHPHLYFAKISMSESIAVLPQVWKIHY